MQFEPTRSQKGEFELLAMLSAGAGAYNDDRAGQKGSFAWVIDGATDLVAEPLVGTASDAEWFAECVHNWMVMHADGLPPDMPLAAIVSELTSVVAREFVHNRTRAPDYVWEHPSAAALIARRTETGVEFFSVGDCTMLIDADDTVRRYGTVAADAGDQWLVERIAKRRQELAHPLSGQPRTLVLEDLRRARERMNSPEGYGVLSITPPPPAFCVEGSIRIDGGGRVLLATDGFMRICDVFAAMNDAGLAAALRTRPLPDLLSELRRIEAEDADCVRCPRAKTSDDATALYLAIAAS